MPESTLTERTYFQGFDYLRALMVTAVIVWHTRLFGGLNLSDISLYSSHGITLSTLICFNFLLLAVPSFFLVSLFLFSIHVKSKKSYFSRRIERLIYLYLFWSGLFLIIRYGSQFDILTTIRSSSIKDIISFMAGQGISVFFFYFSLILMTCTAYFAVKLPSAVLWALVGISLPFFWIVPWAVITQNPPVSLDLYEPSLIVYWNPLSFVPYVFIAILASKSIAKRKWDLGSFHLKAAIGILLLSFIVCSICEWLWISHRSNMINSGYIPSYMRISIVTGATLLFVLSFFVKRQPGRLVSFLSDYSLGMYCLHPFVMGAYIEAFGQSEGDIAYTLCVLVISAIGAYVLRRAFNAGLI